MSSEITVRYAANDNEDVLRAETKAIYAFLVPLYLESGIADHVASPNHGKAMQGIYDCIRTSAALIVEKDGQVIGSLGLVPTEIWYSDTECLGEQWFYILPEHRDGPALKAVLAEIQTLCDQMRLPAIITLARINKPSPRSLQRLGDTFSLTPRGATYRVAPRMAA